MQYKNHSVELHIRPSLMTSVEIYTESFKRVQHLFSQSRWLLPGSQQFFKQNSFEIANSKGMGHVPKILEKKIHLREGFWLLIFIADILWYFQSKIIFFLDPQEKKSQLKFKKYIYKKKKNIIFDIKGYFTIKCLNVEKRHLRELIFVFIKLICVLGMFRY